MQPANADTVLGDFDDVLFEHRGVKTRFFRRNGRYLVETQGGDGARQEYEVSYTFGVAPLQQGDFGCERIQPKALGNAGGIS